MNRVNELRDSTISSTSSTSASPKNAPTTKRNRTNPFVRQFFHDLIKTEIPQTIKPMNARWRRCKKIFPQEWQNLAIEGDEEIFKKSTIADRYNSSPSLLSESDIVINSEAVSGTDKVVVVKTVFSCDNVPLMDANEALVISERMAPRFASRIPVRARKSLPDSLMYNMRENTGLDINRCRRKHTNIAAANGAYDQIIQHIQQHKDLVADIHRVQEKMAALKTKIDTELS